MSKTFLKIKIKSLAAEASIIRREANKPRMVQGDVPGRKVADGFVHSSEVRLALHDHRRFDVRSEARSAQLAYGFLRGRAYRRIEAKCWDSPDCVRVAEIVKKFGPRRDFGSRPILDDIKTWMAAEPVLPLLWAGNMTATGIAVMRTVDAA